MENQEPVEVEEISLGPTDKAKAPRFIKARIRDGKPFYVKGFGKKTTDFVAKEIRQRYPDVAIRVYSPRRDWRAFSEDVEKWGKDTVKESLAKVDASLLRERTRSERSARDLWVYLVNADPVWPAEIRYTADDSDVASIVLLDAPISFNFGDRAAQTAEA